jgi:DNA (cytosine-5)-methyltransferase 1
VRPRLLDLFCGAGGAATGYHRAGFDVVGVDIRPQPRYPFEVHQGDALEFLAEHGHEFDAIHASPTCQTRAAVTAWRGSRQNHPDTLTPTLEALRRLCAPWVVENVPEAALDGTLRPDLFLCGTMFGLRIQRHRVFELSWHPLQLTQPCGSHRLVQPFLHKDERAFADAMGCTWMSVKEARQAIPPAYTEYIGAQLIAHLQETDDNHQG